jgi:NAD(P)-dependent dehydrogenase (short-subunit alcohol dehydrogenase family)
LEDKVALVTGAGKGIGKAVAETFGKEGAKVLVTGRDIEQARKVANAINASGAEAKAARMDVTSRNEIQDVLDNVLLPEFGRVDIVVNNAGVANYKPALELTDKDWDLVIDTNLKGVFLVSQIVARQMVKQGEGGRIINISSMAGKMGVEFLAHYCASKFGVIGLTQSFGIELARHRINVNAICPGYIKTSMQQRGIIERSRLRGVTADEIRQGYLRTVPLGWSAAPTEVAKTVVFLASDASSYMTGQALNITGGACMH